ncbi:class I SAM-dependent methyltransferase [Ornithinibacillus sp. BX22]|uniref:Class I SAM-dependent methyltransferase n=1 Tax=Ornithinibacillus hominis TaxID=2763055 RepID=A0A923L8G0_9BACI|nr:class I SAM-dependent methyltransferase [Ornithinibacillus hominis]MBC5638304.1 class I SAM-dependent methyltransferase [Ornithinibacillus hominis]
MNYGKSFADVYSKHLIHFSVQIAPRIYKYISTKSNKKEVLDLCCGTGQLAYYFLTKDFQVTGIDISNDMLYHAKELSKQFIEKGKAEFYNDDARYFSLNKKFPNIVSTYDALNHLEDEQSLIQCFQQVYEHLEDDGIFIFDLNTKLGLSKGGTFIREEETLFSVAQSMFEPLRNKAFTRYYGFVKNDDSPDYYKYDEVIYNTIFKMEDVREYLYNAGFGSVEFAHLNNLFKIVEEPESEERVFIIATK